MQPLPPPNRDSRVSDIEAIQGTHRRDHVTIPDSLLALFDPGFRYVIPRFSGYGLLHFQNRVKHTLVFAELTIGAWILTHEADRPRVHDTSQLTRQGSNKPLGLGVAHPFGEVVESARVARKDSIAVTKSGELRAVPVAKRRLTS